MGAAVRRNTAAQTVLQAELKAIKAGLELANELNLQCIIMESDCREAINALIKRRAFRNGVGIILENILSAANAFTTVKWKQTLRDGNCFAHFLTKEYQTNCDVCWTDFIPFSFKYWFSNDIVLS